MDALTWILSALVAFVLYLWYELWVVQKDTRGPKGWPVIGCTIDMIRHKDTLFDWLTVFAKEHTTFRVPALHRHFTVTTHPPNIEHILRGNFENYPKGKESFELLEELLGNGIFNTDGDMWKTQRKTASFEFSSRVLRDYSTNAFRDGAVRLYSIIAQASGKDEVVDMQDLFLRMTFDNICTIGFGVEMGTLDPSLPFNEFASCFDAASARAFDRYIDPFWKVKRFLQVGSEGAMIRQRKVLNEFTGNVITERQAELKAQSEAEHKARSDLLSRFIVLGQAHGNPLADREDTNQTLRDMILNFIIAGRDTSAVALSWFFYLLACHPEVEEKIVTELLALEKGEQESSRVEDSVQRFASSLNYETLHHLDYLHAAITETLRLHPSVPLITKTTVADDTLPDGTRLKRGSMITYAAYSMGRVERVWGDDACEFKPERWLKDGVFQPESPYKFISFNAGPRSCLGKDSAYLQMKMAAALILRYFKFELVSTAKVTYRVSLVAPIKDGLKMRVRRRND